MALSIAELTTLNDRIAHALERHIEPIFKAGVKVTLLVRTPGNDEADVLVSAEHDLQDVLDMVARSMSRQAIGGRNVDMVPRLNPRSAPNDESPHSMSADNDGVDHGASSAVPSGVPVVGSDELETEPPYRGPTGALGVEDELERLIDELRHTAYDNGIEFVASGTRNDGAEEEAKEKLIAHVRGVQAAAKTSAEPQPKRGA